MKTANKACSVTAACTLILSLVTAANGTTTIDLQNLPNNMQQANWNGGNTRIYAQSIQTPTIDLRLVTIAFNISGSSLVDFDLVISGTRSNVGGLQLAPDYSDIRYQESYTVGTGGSVSASPNIVFLASETFFVSLVGKSSSGGAYTVEATQNSGTDKYSPGEFVYLSPAYSDSLTSTAINSAEWYHRSVANQDLAFRAEFSAVPEPSSFLLMGFSMMSLVFRRSRG